ncbi:MAG: transporter substrate-binding domain-containing protein [Gammaproteobacteria bacterium]|nr:transporter substrate-binding domain-containing protein [Gammaproteobacteria bacterium]
MRSPRPSPTSNRRPSATPVSAAFSSGAALRIGTTGDYAPFSEIAADGERVGIDIDLARALARSLDVEPVFVDTSWPTLMDDLQAGAFDIAMSGISRTTERARIADFSDAYHVGGKTPIVRCSDRDALDRLDRIDRPEVRVVVNPGGTNERFARATLTRAPLRVFDDNTAIFDEIAEGRADLMFTDAIEVRLRTARDPRLCAAMPGRTLTYQEKGFLLPRDDDGAWRRYLNLWLAGIRGDGTLERIFESHLDPGN